MKRKRHMHILRTVFMAFAVLAVVASPLTIDIGGIRINDVSAQSSSSQQACEADGKHSWQPGYINEMGLEVGATCTPIGASIADKYSETGPTSCSGFLLSMASPFTCAGRALAALTSATLIFAASWILTFSGNLFNWLVENTIIQFSAWYDSISVAVEQAWGAFRDIANILIIGIFTFTAISIILGIKEYGQKKTIAKVLVIAVLINFSLLFAKIIVDASNYTATQIYNTAGLNVGDTSNQSVGAAQQSAAASGIAGTFIDLMGVRGFGNALQSINDIAEARDNGWIALLHGILVFAILGGAALVLLYGSFLLLSRALMIIFLFITASLAFATYLVPKLAATKVGWSTWWSSLLKSAALAPLLMFFLWATLNVAYNLVGPVGSASRGALGDIVTSPDGTASLNAMVSYMMILGLLFITFKLSSSFASGITNFNFAQAVGASPFTLGSRFLVGGLGRLTAGRFAYARGSRLGKEAAELRDEAARTSVAAKRHERSGNFPLADQAREEARKLREAAAGKIKQQAAAGKWAGRRFNFMDTSVAKTATKAVGVTGFASGASSKGTLEQSYADQVKTRAAAAESAAAKVAPSGEDLDKSAEKERMSLFEQRQAHHDQLEATKNAAAANAATLKKPLEEALKTKQAVRNAAERERDANQSQMEQPIDAERERVASANPDYSQARANIHEGEAEKTRINVNHDQVAEQIRQELSTVTDPKRRAQLERDLQQSEEQRASELRHQTDRIEQARVQAQNFEDNSAEAQKIRTLKQEQEDRYQRDNANVTSADRELKTIRDRIGQINAPIEAAKRDIRSWHNETKRLGQEAAGDIKDAMRDSGVEIAERVGEKYGNIVSRAYGGPLTGITAAAKEETKKLYKKKVKTAGLRDVIANIQSDASGPASTNEPPSS